MFPLSYFSPGISFFFIRLFPIAFRKIPTSTKTKSIHTDTGKTPQIQVYLPFLYLHVYIFIKNIVISHHFKNNPTHQPYILHKKTNKNTKFNQ